MNNYASLKLEDQLCFPLYACAKEIVRKYKPYLDQIDLTYTQYLVMMVMWDTDYINVKELGDKLYLDSGTLTPLLKKLENKGYITRERSTADERNLVIKITDKGERIKQFAAKIPGKVSSGVNLEPEKEKMLHSTLYEVLEQL
ncbi:MAG: MarR family transcriptional regulator [Ruminococcus sp.]|nr:MarR family transcriptional regulator [Ruminococcus sp.]